MARRVSFAVVLLAFMGGCTGYRVARLPGAEALPADSRGEPVAVEIGQQARVTLRSGEVRSGEVTAVTPHSITLGKAGNYGFEELEIAATDISEIKTERAGMGDSIILRAIGTAGVVATGIFVVFLVGVRMDGGSS